MDKVKVIILVLLFTAIHVNISEGLPLRTHFAKPSIRATDDQLAKVRFEGAWKEVEEPSVQVTILPLIKEAPDLPEPLHPPNSVKQTTEKYQHLPKKESNNKATPQDKWIVPGLPTPDVDSKGPNTELLTDKDFEATPRSENAAMDENFYLEDIADQIKTNQHQVNSDAGRDHLRGIKRIQRELLSLLETHNYRPPDELYGNKEEYHHTQEKFKPEKDGKEQQSFHEGGEDSFQNENPDLLTSEAEEFSQRKETSGSPDSNTGVHLQEIAPMNIRWHVAHPRTKRNENERYKVRKKRKAQDPQKSSASTMIQGISAGILVLLCVITSIFQLCKNCKKQDQDDAEIGGCHADSGKPKKNKQTCFKTKDSTSKKEKDNTTSGKSSGDQGSNASEEGNNDNADGESSRVHTMEGTSAADETLVSDASPRSEPTSVTPNKTPRNVTASATSLESGTTENEHNHKPTSTSPCGQTSDDNDRNVEAKYSRDFLPEAPVTPMQASISSVADANSANSSKESCKTPVAPLNEVVIDIENDEEIKSEEVPSKENSSSEVLCSSGADSVTKVAPNINGNTLEHDNGDEPLLRSDSESSSGELIYQSSETQAKMADSDVKVESSAVPFPPPPPIPPTQPSSPATPERDETTGRRNKEKRQVIREMEGEIHNPSLQQLIQIASSTIKQNETTRDSNAKGQHKREIIENDAITMKFKRTKRTFTHDIKFARSVICCPPAVDHADLLLPQMDCVCYYCHKDWKKTRGRPYFHRSKPTLDTKEFAVIDGTVYISSPGHTGRPFFCLRPTSVGHLSPAGACS